MHSSALSRLSLRSLRRFFAIFAVKLLEVAFCDLNPV